MQFLSATAFSAGGQDATRWMRGWPSWMRGWSRWGSMGPLTIIVCLALTEFNAKLPPDASWTRDPLLVASRLVAGWPQYWPEDREFREMWDSTSSDIEVVFASGELPDGVRVTVLRDGFRDDSVRDDAHRIELRRQADGSWQPVAAEVFLRCWRGDVADQFIAENCP